MAIGLRASGSATYDAATTPTTVTKPAAVQAGDVMVLSVSPGWGIGSVTITAPTGWTAIANNVGGSGTNSEVVGCFYRVAQVGDTTWGVAVVGSGGAAIEVGIALQAFTGVDTATPIDATGATATGTGSATISAPAVTVATAGAWEVIAAGTWNGAAMSATGFTALNNGNPAANEQVALLYNQTPKSTGSTGTVTVNGGTASGNTMSAIPFALRPAAGAQDPIGVASAACMATP